MPKASTGADNKRLKYDTNDVDDDDEREVVHSQSFMSYTVHVVVFLINMQLATKLLLVSHARPTNSS